MDAMGEDPSGEDGNARLYRQWADKMKREGYQFGEEGGHRAVRQDVYHESAAELADLAEMMPSPGRSESKKFEWAVSEWVHDTVPHARIAVVDEDTEEVTGVQERFNKHMGKRMKYFGSQVLIAGLPKGDKNAKHNGKTAEVLESVKPEGAYASMYRCVLTCFVFESLFLFFFFD